MMNQAGEARDNVSDERFAIRAATPSDVEEIAELAVALGRLHVGFDPKRFGFTPFGRDSDEVRRTYVEFFADHVARADSALLVAVSDQARMVGYVFGRLEEKSFLDLSDAAGWIHDLYVDEGTRARGVGSRMLDAATASLRQLGARQIRLSVAPRNAPARRLFDRQGFVPTMIECRLDGPASSSSVVNPATASRADVTLRPVSPTDRAALVSLAIATGLFRPEEAESLLGGVLDELRAGRLGPGHLVHVSVDGTGTPTGWVYASADENAEGVWELWWIGVAPDRQGRGVGAELLRFVEAHARDAGGRLLLIATSSLPSLARTRGFYAKRGYESSGRIPDFYGDGDDKVIFAKRLVPRPP